MAIWALLFEGGKGRREAVCLPSLKGSMGGLGSTFTGGGGKPSVCVGAGGRAGYSGQQFQGLSLGSQLF